MTEPEERYEVVERQPTKEQVAFGQVRSTFVVWDNRLAKSVPFGNYGSRDRAERRLKRVKEGRE